MFGNGHQHNSSKSYAVVFLKIKFWRRAGARDTENKRMNRRLRALVSFIVRGRRWRVLTVFVLCSLLSFALYWKRSNVVRLYGRLRRRGCETKPEQVLLPIPSVTIPYYNKLSTDRLPFADILEDEARSYQVPVTLPEKYQINTTLNLLRARQQPSFHILIPASETNEKLCKTLLSSFLLNYPSPTLINFGEVFTGDSWDKGSHAGKIKGVYDFLNKDKKVRDDDLVLVIDGYDVWFQLPPEVMVKRYHILIHETNQRLRKQYGLTVQEKPWEGGQKKKVQRYQQTVIFGADKICWPNQAKDPACASLPESTMPKNAYGLNTDKDPEAFSNRPKYLNSGTLIGPVTDVRAIYERALEKVEQGLGALGDQFVFAEILGEQEYQRQMNNPRVDTPWSIHAFDIFRYFSNPEASGKAVKNVTLVPGRRYDFAIGLDYKSSLFQTMTHSASDIAFLTFASKDKNSTTQEFSQLAPITVPQDIISARPPFPTNDTPTTLATSRLIPLSASLDTLPLPDQNSWLNYPLGTNLRSFAIPTILHINGDKSLLDSWWPSLWFQPYGRTLLRHYVRTPQPFIWGTVNGEERTWDRKGGRGGIWTPKGWWLEWGIICEGVEESVFADGKGNWGLEEGDGKTFNAFGSQVTGKVEKGG